MATVKLVVNIEIMLPKTKIPSTSNIAFLRLTPENNNGIVGPDIDTVRAKRLTSHPAFDTLI
jgi:hypothetical protein